MNNGCKNVSKVEQLHGAVRSLLSVMCVRSIEINYVYF